MEKIGGCFNCGGVREDKTEGEEGGISNTKNI